MVIALDASSPSPVYADTSSTTSLVSASFTPPSGSIVIVKIFNGNAAQTIGTVTASGLTFTSRANLGTAGSSTRVAIFTAIGAGAATAVTVTFATNATHGMTIEVWTDASLAASPAVHSIVTSSTGAPIDTITTTGTNSVVSWVCNDWNATTGTRTYRSSATEINYKTLTGQYTSETAYQSAAAAGSQTYGVTAPAGQWYTIAAIELQQAAGGAAIPPIIVMPPRRP